MTPFAGVGLLAIPITFIGNDHHETLTFIVGQCGGTMR
jgi:hypothetical protein